MTLFVGIFGIMWHSPAPFLVCCVYPLGARAPDILLGQFVQAGYWDKFVQSLKGKVVMFSCALDYAVLFSCSWTGDSLVPVGFSHELVKRIRIEGFSKGMVAFGGRRAGWIGVDI